MVVKFGKSAVKASGEGYFLINAVINLFSMQTKYSQSPQTGLDFQQQVLYLDT